MHRDPFVCTDEVAVDAATLAAIGRGIKDADQVWISARFKPR